MAYARIGRLCSPVLVRLGPMSGEFADSSLVGVLTVTHWVRDLLDNSKKIPRVNHRFSPVFLIHYRAVKDPSKKTKQISPREENESVSS
jgi:hypothetical protein